MVNIDEYILRYKEFKEGNYECGTIFSRYEVKKIVEEGKKIVFVGSNTDAIKYFAFASILLFLMLIIILSMARFFSDWFVFAGVLEFMGIPSIFIVILGLLKLRTRFMVLGHEGIVYKLCSRGVNGYNWKDIKIDFYNYSYIKSEGSIPFTKSVKIHIFMPNGDLIKAEPEDYTCHEIPSYKYRPNNGTLFMLLFSFYYDYGKDGEFSWEAVRAEQHNRRLEPAKYTMSTDMLIIDTWRDQLKEALYNYKKKKYKLGKFWTNEQIQDEFLKKRVFVLKGGVHIGIWIITLIPFIPLSILILITFFKTFDLFQLLSLIVTLVITWLSLSSPLFFILRGFLVISSSGVYYRNFIRKKIFSWDDISKIEGTTKDDSLIKNFAVVKVFLLSGKTISFSSIKYKNEEFSKKVWVEMFFNLFNCNFKFSKNSFY
ncbi:hypothetical protein LCGC14_2316820 [marine sediment metagenome]|uniref:Uncharacterized protein n=1 Tax=marine sediment metagenome TaxID=412755 RepID=A0A0F9FDX5_9ZZZZ